MLQTVQPILGRSRLPWNNQILKHLLGLSLPSVHDFIYPFYADLLIVLHFRLFFAQSQVLNDRYSASTCTIIIKARI